MARQENQKLKLLAVKEYLEQYSDQDHRLSPAFSVVNSP